jgi:hypothetical protein
MIAFDHCDGGAPILDSFLVTPFLVGLSLYLIGRGIDHDLKPTFWAALSLPLLCLSLWVAWKAGTNNSENRSDAEQ